MMSPFDRLSDDGGHGARGSVSAHLPAPKPVSTGPFEGPFLRVVRQGGGVALEGRTIAVLGPARRSAVGWARWQWSGRTLLAETCRYGIRPLFYHATADRILIAPSIATLLALGAPSELDPVALGVFLRFENFLGEDTPFKHIRAMPPAGRLEWSGTLRVTGAPLQVAPHKLGRRVALKAYARLFRDAIERSLADDGIVPLSGGCDSRHIAFEAARCNRLAECVSVRALPPRADEDARIAVQVAQTLGAHHVVLDQDPDRFGAVVQATIDTSYCGREHAWFRPMARYLADTAPPGSAVLDGLGGDVLSAGLFLEPIAHGLFRRGRLVELARRYLGLEGRLGHLPFLADQALAPAELAIARLTAELDRHQHAANPVGAFYFWNRTRRVVALQFLAVLGGRRTIMPYLDPELFDLLAGLPAQMLLDHRFHREALHLAFPEFAGIAFAASRPRAATPREHFRRYGRAILDRLDAQPSRLIKARHARPRIAYLAWSGTEACWTADACLYLSQLEYAGREPISDVSRR
jgi:asparagine synthetase B (glutamine-hydrolysing)